jgi:hypothetical protein
LDWISNNGLLLASTLAISVVSLLLVLIVVPFAVSRLPEDYFRHSHREPAYLGYRHPLIGMLMAALKNLIGLVLVLLGIIMILTPGQGLLTILLGVLMLNFPGKYQLELWLVRQPRVLPTLNWLRGVFNKPPLLPPAQLQPAAETEE